MGSGRMHVFLLFRSLAIYDVGLIIGYSKLPYAKNVSVSVFIMFFSLLRETILDWPCIQQVDMLQRVCVSVSVSQLILGSEKCMGVKRFPIQL